MCRKHHIGVLAIAALVAVGATTGEPGLALGQGGVQKSGAVAALPIRGVFIAIADVNVRTAPKGTSRKVGFLRQGTRVDVVGITRDKGWLVILENGAVKGFVSASAMVRGIDGALRDDITGNQAADGVSCAYRIHFEGRIPVEGEPFQTANYAVVFHCERGQGRGDGQDGEAVEKANFFAQMFLSEASAKEKRKAPATHQLTVDVRLIDSGGEDDIVSTSFLYDPEGGRLLFDAPGGAKNDDAKYQGTMRTKSAAASSVEEAVNQALRQSMRNWNALFWDRIFTAAGSASGRGG